MGFINKQELKYMSYAIGFYFIFFAIAVPLLIKAGIEKLNPFLLFLFFNIAIIIFLQIYFKAKALDKKVQVRKTLELLLIFIVFDIGIPPLMVSPSGMLNTGPILSGASADYVAGYIGQSMGISGFFLFLFVYLIIPNILLFLASKINGNFVQMI